MDALKLMAESCMKKDLPVVNIGDTVRVGVKIKEGDRERIQAFEGTVIAKKHGVTAKRSLLKAPFLFLSEKCLYKFRDLR